MRCQLYGKCSLSLLLVLIMIFSLLTPAFAQTSVSDTSIASKQENLAQGSSVIVSGNEPGANGSPEGAVDGNTWSYWSAWPLMKEVGDMEPSNQKPAPVEMTQ